jgi:hypothetical protein
MSCNVGTYNAFHTAGAAKALTASYVNGDTVQPARPCNTARLLCTLAWGTAPTNARVKIFWTPDGTTWVPVSVVNSISAGVVSLGDGIFDLPVAAAGTHEILANVPPGADLKCQAAMVDAGGSDPTLLAKFVLTDE